MTRILTDDLRPLSTPWPVADHGWLYEGHWALSRVDPVVLRVRVFRDSGGSVPYARADVWAAEALRWNEVARLLPAEMAVLAAGVVPRMTNLPLEEAALAAFDSDVDDLLDKARMVLLGRYFPSR